MVARDKDNRLFIRLDLDYADHPKIIGLSDAAFRAHITMMLYSRKYETDGVIKKPIANRLGSQWDTDVLAELQNNDDETPSLVFVEDGSYELHGFADMQETKAEIQARTERNRANGAKGGRPRKPKETHSVSGSGGDSGTQTKAEIETEIETEVSSKELTNARDLEPLFDAAYSRWPKKDKRKESLAKFKIACRKRDPEELAADIVRFGDAYAATTEVQYVPALVVWLNGERWTDALPQARSNQQQPQQVSRADEAHDFISRLEAIDAVSGGGAVVGDRPQLR